MGHKSEKSLWPSENLYASSTLNAFFSETVAPSHVNKQSKDIGEKELELLSAGGTQENSQPDIEQSAKDIQLIRPDMTSEKKLTRPPMRKASINCDSVLQTTNKYLKKRRVEEDPYNIFAKNLSMKLRDVSNKTQKLLAEKIINEVLFMAEMDQLILPYTTSALSFSAI
ncbi:hypothetical protein ABEB36_005855 [Hypothenemus hampei]|uniref:Uncharacterized protein n=1 Tax=Hypothenemus hampei TaxID=57062 RepID=A0ABD1F3H6_HYPHA